MKLTQPTPADVKALRAFLGMTQEAFATMSHSKYRTVQDWEAGKRDMPLAVWELYLLKAGQLKLEVVGPVR